MVMKTSSITVFSIALVVALTTTASADGVPPMPARVGGSLTIDGQPVSQGDQSNIVIMVTRTDESPYEPPAIDDDGLNEQSWYLVDIPLFDPNGQPGGAVVGDAAVIHVVSGTAELEVISPVGGALSVGASGSTTQIDLECATSVQPSAGVPELGQIARWVFISVMMMSGAWFLKRRT